MSRAHCKAKRADGQPCQMAAGKSGFCFNHDPKQGRARAQARKQGGERHRVPHFAQAWAGDIVSAADSRRILAYVLAELLGMDNSILRARALLAVHEGYIKSFEIGEIEQRLSALETALNVGG